MMNFKRLLKLSIWSGVKFRNSNRREYLSTNDLNQDRTIKKNYKSQRKKDENRPRSYGIGPEI